MEQRVSISISDGIADVRLVRAEKMNALDMPMFEALVAATGRLATEKRLRAVILSGEGRSFCAGLDMDRFAARIASGLLPAISRASSNAAARGSSAMRVASP